MPLDTCWVTNQKLAEFFKSTKFVPFKRTVRRYQNRAITHYFTGSEIITEPKVCVNLRYLHKDAK